MAEPARKPGIVVAARALVLHRDHVLLLHAVEPGREYYFLPGGGARHGETLADACAREVKEETGLAVTVTRPLFLREFIAARHRKRPQGMPEQQHALAMIFLCAVTGEAARLDPDDLGQFQRDVGATTVQGLRWVPLADVGGIEIHPPHVKEAIVRGLPERGIEFWPES